MLTLSVIKVSRCYWKLLAGLDDLSEMRWGVNWKSNSEINNQSERKMELFRSVSDPVFKVSRWMSANGGKWKECKLGKKSWLRGSRLEFFLRQQWFSNKIKFPHDSQSETKFGTFMEPRELKENIRNMKSIGKVERLHWRSTKDHSYGAQVVVVIVIGCWRCVYRGSQLGEGDPWRRPPRLGPSSVRRAMVGCPTQQAHNTHSPPCHHKAGDDRVLHRLVRRRRLSAATKFPRGRQTHRPSWMAAGGAPPNFLWYSILSHSRQPGQLCPILLLIVFSDFWELVNMPVCFKARLPHACWRESEDGVCLVDGRMACRVGSTFLSILWTEW